MVNDGYQWLVGGLGQTSLETDSKNFNHPSPSEQPSVFNLRPVTRSYNPALAVALGGPTKVPGIRLGQA